MIIALVKIAGDGNNGDEDFDGNSIYNGDDHGNDGVDNER